MTTEIITQSCQIHPRWQTHCNHLSAAKGTVSI